MSSLDPTAPSLPTEVSDTSADGINCMDVWGGTGTTQNYLRRPGLDVWVWSQSQASPEHGGGDLHLLSSCASGRITRMLLADVCGFGTLFIDIAGQLRDLMKQNVNSIRQSGLVRELFVKLSSASERGCFASTLVSTYFAPTRSFTICNAGHPPPLVFQSKTGVWSCAKASTSL